MTDRRGRRLLASAHRRAATSTVVLVAVLTLAMLPSPVDAVQAPGRDGAPRNYIVTLDVADAGRAIDPAARSGRARVRLRAQRTRSTTDRLERDHGFRASQRFAYAVSGFSARLTPGQVARLGRDDTVASVRPARRYRLASQVTPGGILRTRAAPSGGPAVDADIAILDTGIGPVGGNELNVQGGINCSNDGLGANEWSDLYRSRHGTHVAGTAAARDNGIGTVGVAPGARLWSVRVFRANGYGDEATIICGLDWALATRGPTPPAGSQPIEVVNMSLEGPRPADDPEGCAGRPTPDPDPMHQAVCAVHAAGITMVVAAGNDGTDARFVSPAGYDQVITVGALSDFDGQPGARSAATCGGTVLGSEGDDRWARYSNRGADVDILAPGTCVLSTFPTGSGDATQRLTGTSMASPHVAGAAARYLAAHPGTDPERMRRLLRGAGRLDWEVGSDPNWDGPSDTTAPRRLLDVTALFGSPGLRAWVVPHTLVAAARTDRRRARVDIQRLGGFDGSVSLALEGLPGAVGDASFAPASLGLGDLGARLTLDLDQGASEGRYALRVRAAGGPDVRGRPLTLRVDRSGPVIRDLRLSIRGARAAIRRGGSASIRVAWAVDDALGSVGRTALQRRVGNGAWREVAAGAGMTKATTTVRAGSPTSLRVTSRDDVGNASRSRVREVRLTMRDSSSASWLRPSSGWQSTSSGSAIGGSLLVTRSQSSSATTELEGEAFAIVAPVGPSRGKLRIRLDGGPWRTVGLRAPKARARQVVYQADLKRGSHTLEVRADSGQAVIDAVLILR